MTRRLVASVLVVLLSAACVLADPPERPWKTDAHFIMNHRSGRVFAPQETVPAIRYSVRAGADAIDVDLRKTADGVIVCFHDGWVMTRECFGPVEDLSWSLLSRADVGWEFDTKFAGTRILTFEEVVRFCAANGIRFHLESKAGEKIAGDVMRIIDRYKAIALVVDMQRLPRPDREDYRPVQFHAHTMGGGADDDRWVLRRRIARSRRGSFHLNAEDTLAFAEVLDRHPERRKLGAFKLDPVPLVPKGGYDPAELLRDLKGDDERKAIAATNRLVGQRERAALGTLREHAAKHVSVKVRAVALWALGRLNDVESFALLAKTAESTPKDAWIVPYAAMFALSDLDTPEAVKVLARVVKRGLPDGTATRLGPNGWYGEDALIVLGRMKTPAAVDVLGDAVRSKPVNRYLTQTAAASLARIGGTKAIAHLVRCLDEARRAHRREIVWALVRLAPGSLPAVVDRLSQTAAPVVTTNGLRVLGRCKTGDRRVASLLLRCLGSASAEVRAEAAWVCGRRALRQAAPRLRTLLKDDNEDVRLDAAQALRRLKVD